MKVGIMTIFKTGNYGGILQAYALKKAIEEYGLGDAKIINYSSKSVEGKVTVKEFFSKGLFGMALYVVEKLYYYPRMKKMRKFSSELVEGPQLERDELKRLNDEYDIFLSGSDQIWNLKIQEGDTSYLLDFVKEKNKKRSYASSFGTKDFDEETMQTLKSLLKDYEKITIREVGGQELIYDLLGKKVDVVLDPTLLLDKKSWKDLVHADSENKDYIFCYQMGHSAKIANYASKISKEIKAKKIVFVPFPICGICKCICKLGYSAKDWLSAIYHSKCIVTDSFHGIVFSLIFEKDFYYVVTSSTVRERMGRVKTLLSKLDLEDRIIDDNELEFSSINYQKVNQLLSKEREKSLELLRWVLN